MINKNAIESALEALSGQFLGKVAKVDWLQFSSRYYKSPVNTKEMYTRAGLESSIESQAITPYALKSLRDKMESTVDGRIYYPVLLDMLGRFLYQFPTYADFEKYMLTL